ncbi:MAG: glutaredoxin family protein [Chloroflexi bacterium]|nr:glutaredoxin family protein [Chloroflexota bacterium]
MAELVLYGAAGCTLCAEAAAQLAPLRRAYRLVYREVDIHDDTALARRYLLEVPVVTVDGVVASAGPLDLDAVRAALRRAGLL